MVFLLLKTFDSAKRRADKVLLDVVSLIFICMFVDLSLYGLLICQIGDKNTKKLCSKQKIQAKISLFTTYLVISQSNFNINSYKFMEIEGKIIVVLPAREGVSARGTQWKAQSYVIETREQYPRKCCFDVFGADKIEAFNIQSGEDLRVSFDIDAHEYQGRWYNSVRAWKVDRIDPAAMQNAMAGAPYMQPAPMGAPAAPAPMGAPVAPAQPQSTEAPFPPQQEGGSVDDLPF